MEDGIPPIEQPDMPPAPSGDETTAGFAISIPQSKLHPRLGHSPSSSFLVFILPGFIPSFLFRSWPSFITWVFFSPCFILLPPLTMIILALSSFHILLFHILRQFFLPIFIHILYRSILPSLSHPAIHPPKLLASTHHHSLLFILFSKIWTSSLWNSASSPKISSPPSIHASDYHHHPHP